MADKQFKTWQKLTGIAAAAAIGGFISRMAGGGWPKLPWGLDQWLYALPYAAVYCFLPWEWYVNLPVALAAYGLGVLGKRMGHGQYFHLNFSPRQPEELDEKIEPFVRFFFGFDRGGQGSKRYWRGVFGLAVTGAICAIGAAVALAAAGHWLPAAIIFIGGAAKALAYMLGWWARKQAEKAGLCGLHTDAARVKTVWDKVFQPTVWGEIITGVFGWGSAVYAYILTGKDWMV